MFGMLPASCTIHVYAFVLLSQLLVRRGDICYISYDLPLALKSDQSSNGSAKLDAELTMSNETCTPDQTVVY